MFLVIHRSNLDDIPCGLFQTRAEAEACAATIPVDQPEDWLTMMKVDRSGPISVAIVEFIDSRPVSMEVVRIFEGELAGHAG